MTMVRFPLMVAMAIAVSVSGFNSTSARADDGHTHAAGHDHEAMMKAEKKIEQSLSSLSADDQKLVKAQRFCPVMTYDRLGAMGTPLKLVIEGKPVFVCCKACVDEANAGVAKTVKTVEKLRDSTETLAKLPMGDRAAIEAQKYCAVANTSFLGSMGVPIKLDIDGKPVYLCCGGCTKKAQANPAATLAKAEELKKAGTIEGHDHADHSGHQH
ncbi:hypothetical protein [Novipirellula artificiosorum]|uniref:Secreted protein n=1 Tax=Novipirellula artificiosorum TaxID=2528016 RepID=A0A5C6DRN6_9BACT|nr:hypothetical protein [Novipirellula artificiosorum]TWU39428.1 hypothetical protein Poly41_22520 [Novipirellula artificiosorum]